MADDVALPHQSDPPALATDDGDQAERPKSRKHRKHRKHRKRYKHRKHRSSESTELGVDDMQDDSSGEHSTDESSAQSPVESQDSYPLRVRADSMSFLGQLRVSSHTQRLVERISGATTPQTPNSPVAIRAAGSETSGVVSQRLKLMHRRAQIHKHVHTHRRWHSESGFIMGGTLLQRAADADSADSADSVDSVDSVDSGTIHPTVSPVIPACHNDSDGGVDSKRVETANAASTAVDSDSQEPVVGGSRLLFDRRRCQSGSGSVVVSKVVEDQTACKCENSDASALFSDGRVVSSLAEPDIHGSGAIGPIPPERSRVEPERAPPPQCQQPLHEEYKEHKEYPEHEELQEEHEEHPEHQELEEEDDEPTSALLARHESGVTHVDRPGRCDSADIASNGLCASTDVSIPLHFKHINAYSAEHVNNASDNGHGRDSPLHLQAHEPMCRKETAVTSPRQDVKRDATRRRGCQPSPPRVGPKLRRKLLALFKWIDSMPLSRPKRNIYRDFSDASRVAEIVHFRFPLLCDVHNYPHINSFEGKQYNWRTFNCKVLRRHFDMELDQRLIADLSRARKSAIENFLLCLKKKMEWKRRRRRKKASKRRGKASRTSSKRKMTSTGAVLALQHDPIRSSSQTRVHLAPRAAVESPPDLSTFGTEDTALASSLSLAPPSPPQSSSSSHSSQSPLVSDLVGSDDYVADGRNTPSVQWKLVCERQLAQIRQQETLLADWSRETEKLRRVLVQRDGTVAMLNERVEVLESDLGKALQLVQLKEQKIQLLHRMNNEAETR